VTDALNCWVLPERILAVRGDIETASLFGTTATFASENLEESVWLAALTITVMED
jgi:hypothetical protein